MRVVAGSARGMKLLAVPGHGTRPILDRVKTCLFDILRPRLSGLDVLDVLKVHRDVFRYPVERLFS